MCFTADDVYQQYQSAGQSAIDLFRNLVNPQYPDLPAPPPPPAPPPEQGARRVWEPIPYEEEQASRPIGIEQLRIPTPPTVST